MKKNDTSFSLPPAILHIAVECTPRENDDGCKEHTVEPQRVRHPNLQSQQGYDKHAEKAGRSKPRSTFTKYTDALSKLRGHGAVPSLGEEPINFRLKVEMNIREKTDDKR